MKRKTARFLISLGILVLMGVLVSAYYQQFFVQGIPCPLCVLQRLGMVAVGSIALMNLRFGIHLKYYALSILAACIGGAVSIWQILLNICPGKPLFGMPVLGLNLYTWGFLVFAASILGTTLLIFFYRPEHEEPSKMNGLEKCSAGILILLTAANCVTTFQECGLGTCEEKNSPPQTDLRAER